MWTIAIGDIHGHSEKLRALLLLVEHWRRDHADGGSDRLVFLGDYIDRGPDSRGVLSIVRSLQKQGAICLRGNHEELMIRATVSETDRQNFLVNGGLETLQSFGSRAVFDEAREWMTSLPTFYETTMQYFVHAGVRPEEPLGSQSDRDRMWIRGPFLKCERPFEKYIVHGHTPVARDDASAFPDVRDNRCNVDTGAAWSGPLSAVVFNEYSLGPIWILTTTSGIVRA